MGFDIKKLFVHSSCVVAQDQLSSYEYDSENEKTGAVRVIKVKDEAPDVWRYTASTMLKGASLWYKDGEPIGQSTILYDDEEKKEKRDARNQIAAKIQRKIAERGRQRFWTRTNKNK